MENAPRSIGVAYIPSPSPNNPLSTQEGPVSQPVQQTLPSIPTSTTLDPKENSSGYTNNKLPTERPATLLYLPPPPSPSRYGNERHFSRQGSPASSAGSERSQTSFPPGSRRRRRTLSRVSSEEILNRIRNWDDGREKSTTPSYSRLPTPPLPTPPLPTPQFPRHLTSLDKAPLSNKDIINRDYKCTHPGCTAPPFQTEYLLNSHANVHSQDRPYFCPVEGCPRAIGGKGFKRKNEMMRHGLVHNPTGYICPFCPNQQLKYPRPDNLQRHVRVYHVDKDKNDPALRKALAQRPVGVRNRRRRSRDESKV